MEASALYAFAQVCHKAVICFAHITNQMGNLEGDFEKTVISVRGMGSGQAKKLELNGMITLNRPVFA